MHKRISFQHEQEIRIVKGLAEHWSTSESPDSTSIDWVPEDTVNAIIVNPYAAAFYRDVVVSIVRHISPTLIEKIKWSPMRALPVY